MEKQASYLIKFSLPFDFWRRLFFYLVFMASLMPNIYSQIIEEKKIELTFWQRDYINLYDVGLAVIDDDKIVFYDESLTQLGEIKNDFIYSIKDSRSYYYDSALKKIICFSSDYDGEYVTLINPNKAKSEKFLIKFNGRKNDLLQKLVLFDKSVYGVLIKKDQTILGKIDLDQGEISPLKLSIEWERRKILKISKVNSKSFAVLFLDENEPKNAKTNIALFDNLGLVITNKLITNTDNDFHILDFTITDAGNDNFNISGIYYKKVEIKKISLLLENTEPSGMFIAQIEDYKLDDIKYFSHYSVLQKFNERNDPNWKHYKDDKTYNNEKYYQFNTLMHPLIDNNGQYILISEIYYPVQYSLNPGHNSALDGQHKVESSYYNWSFAIVLILDEKLKILNTFKIPMNFKNNPKQLSHRLKVVIDEDELNFYYINGDTLVKNSIFDDELREKKRVIYKGVKNSSDHSSSHYYSANWYDDYFYTIKNEYIDPQGKGSSNEYIDYYLIKYKLK